MEVTALPAVPVKKPVSEATRKKLSLGARRRWNERRKVAAKLTAQKAVQTAKQKQAVISQSSLPVKREETFTALLKELHSHVEAVDRIVEQLIRKV